MEVRTKAGGFTLFLIIVVLLLFAGQGYSQRSNRPSYQYSGKERLGEKDANFSGKKKRKVKISLGRKKGFNHKKSYQSFSTPRKKNREGFYSKRYGKKRWLFPKEGTGWGGKAYKKNSKEDKRLFKAPKNKAKSKKNKILGKQRRRSGY